MENLDLKRLGIQTFSQNALEANLSRQADRAIANNQDKLDFRLLEKENLRLLELETKQAKFESDGVLSSSAAFQSIQSQIEDCKASKLEISQRILERKKKAETERRSSESKDDYLLRIGAITPFERSNASFIKGPISNAIDEHEPNSFSIEQDPQGPSKRRKIEISSAGDSQSTKAPSDVKVPGFEYDYEDTFSTLDRPKRSTASYENKQIVISTGTDDSAEESDDFLFDEDESSDSTTSTMPRLRQGQSKYRNKTAKRTPLDQADDGNEQVYQERLKLWAIARKNLRNTSGFDEGSARGTEEWHLPHPRYGELQVDEYFRLPGDVAQSLFDYQKTGVKWLWELYTQRTGGILGDEMGLGKTIQMISFISGLHYSKKLKRPALVVAPATVLRQWANEFRKWWPPMRVSILHSTGSGMISMKAESEIEKRMNDENEDGFEPARKTSDRKTSTAAQKIVKRVVEQGHVLITTYAGIQTHGDILLPVEWECVALDEGHRIRNPDAAISLRCKQIKSATRIILSGTPIQNSLVELWSLFDFVYPGKLGVLPVFKQQIELPIRLGGYTNASNVQVQAAYKCAVVLKEIISPFMLRRFKSDVTVLPGKEDLVLFCNPVQKQKDDYERYLKSKEVGLIFEGKRDMLAGIDVLRKICNHPDLADRVNLLRTPGYKYGSASKSGKMQIVKGLLKTWQGNSKSLIFTQGTQMLDILEKLVQYLKVNYLRMDGTTPVGKRQALVDEFNNNAEIMTFLLTTRVGGLGVNLTGASRVIIYDPDWNPSHDIQARERSWRLGQKKDVKIYRLLVRGTIEEKIYQRQLFKQFLSKKVLENPHQRRLFKLEDIHDLFSFGQLDEGTETGQLLYGLEKAVKPDEEQEEIQKLPGVDRLEPNYAIERPGDSKMPSSTGSDLMNSGDQLLEGVLAQAGVHSIIQHDEVIEGSVQTQSIAELEATRIAKNAAIALEESSRATRSSQIGTVTWTGRSGAAGKTSAVLVGKAGVSGSKVTREPNSGHVANARSDNDLLSETRLREMIVKFFSDHGQKPSSKHIAEYFNTVLPSDIPVERFRACLKSLASFDRKSGTWRLSKS